MAAVNFLASKNETIVFQSDQWVLVIADWLPPPSPKKQKNQSASTLLELQDNPLVSRENPSLTNLLDEVSTLEIHSFEIFLRWQSSSSSLISFFP